MNNRRHFLFGSSIIFLLFACVLLWSPGQANAAYKISYDSTSLTADSLTITVAWNSTGSYDWDNGARPYFSVNGVIKQYDWSPGTASPLNYFSANLQVGTNTFSMWSNAGDQDDCGCGGNASPDAVYAKVTFANGQSLYTGSSPWSPGGGTLLTLPAVCSPSYPSYIQNNPCGNCCYTQVSKTISVVLSPTATISQSSASTISGTPYNITWNSTNALNCTLVETQSYNGSSYTLTVMPYGRMDLGTTIPGTYVDTISCTGAGGTSAPVSVTHIVTTACNLPWGGAIPGGQSVTAYQSSSVVSPATCISETRTCINYVPAIYTVGVLSGSYVYQSCTVAPPAPTVSLIANPNPVAYNTGATLTWTTTNATSCWATNGWTGWKTNTGGSESTGPLTAAKTYSLQCWNSANVSTGIKTITVNVNAAPLATLTLSASPNPAAYGAASTLSWTTSNATSCWASNGWTGWKTNTGGSESTGALTATKAYSLQCWNSAGVSTGVKTGTVNVNAAPTLSLSAAPNPVAYGAASTLSWTTSNATSCWATNGWTGWKTNTGGSESIGTLTATKVYSLQCWNSAGVSTGVKTGTVNVNAAPTPVTTFNSSSLSLPVGGGNITLNWSVTDAIPGTCTGYSNTNIADWALGGTGGKPTNGNIPVAVTESTTFNLDCWNTVVSPWIPAVRASVTVNVCVPNCDGAGTHCPGVTYNDSCGNPTCTNGTLPQNCPGGWGACSKSCGGGIQTRTCSCPPENQTRSCSAQPCPPGYKEVAPW